MSIKTRYFLFLSLLVVLGVLPSLPAGRSAETNQAAVVVAFGDGRVESRCVDFSETAISGLDLLDRSGLSYVVDANGGNGAAVCQIDGTGCPAGNCFCECSGGGDCIYWSYWLRLTGVWQYSLIGASSSVVTDGTIEGWSWGPGNPGSAIAPPDLAFSDVCVPPVTATAVATATPEPSATPIPTDTPVPSATLAPTISFTVDANSVPAGSCTTLRWAVANVNAVYLDEVGVSGQGEREVCPAGTQTYRLRVVHGAGEVTQEVTVGVVTATATATVAVTAVINNTATSVPAGATAQPITPATPTSPATVESTAIMPTVTPSATTSNEIGQTNSTATAIVVVAPALPTAIPSAEAVAVVADSSPTSQPPGALTATDGFSPAVWLPYLVFGVIVLGLGVVLVVVRRGK